MTKRASLPPPPRPDRRSFFRVSAASVLGLSWGTCPATVQAADPGAADVGQAVQLFLDDGLAATTKGLVKRWHRPRKAGLIREADGKPWERGDQVAVIREAAGRFHMLYRLAWEDPAVRDLHSGIGQDKAHWFRETVGYAQSQDGIHWAKPVLGLAEGPTGFRRAPREKWADGVFWEPTGFSRRNNLGCPLAMIQDLAQFGGVSDPKHRYLVNVVHKSDTHPFAEIDDAGLYFAAAVPDLVHDPGWRQRLEVIWEGRRRGPRGPTVRVAGFDSKENVWVECAQCSFGNIIRLGSRCISRWTSRDLREWSAEQLVLPVAPDELRRPDDWVEYMDIRVVRLHDYWLGQLVVFHADRRSPQYEMPTRPGVWRKGTTELRLIVSRDAGRTWQRLGGTQAWLPHHEAEDGYDRLVFTGSPVRIGDELWLYYGCWDGDHLVWNRDGTTFYRDRTRVGRTARAVLRWDGFQSLRGESEAGEATTRPLRCGGHRLAVNAAAAHGGVRVEVQDRAGKALPGFALADCEPLAEDGLAQAVRWRGKADLPRVREQPVRLRFEVRNADLYGFQFVDG
jgi:hypothetical protein